MICQKLVVTETMAKKNTKKETGLKKKLEHDGY